MNAVSLCRSAPPPNGGAPIARGFTLVELLAVIAIGTIILGLVVPAVTGLSGAGNVNNAVTSISLLLNQCRAYAMGHNTYVWVGFYPSTTTYNLTIGVVAGTTGQSNDWASNLTYSPIYKLQTFNNLETKVISGLSGMATSADTIPLAQGTPPFTFQERGATLVTFSQILQFDPAGEASVNSALDTAHWVQIGLQPMHGSNATGLDVAVLQVGTLTGQVQVYRR